MYGGSLQIHTAHAPGENRRVGANSFLLRAVEVTPPPYNQPPWLPPGDSDTGQCTITAAADQSTIFAPITSPFTLPPSER